MTKNIIIALFSISVLSPAIGIVVSKIFEPRGDAAGKGITAGLTVLLFMFLASLIGGIASSLLWAFSKDPLPFWAKAMTILTYLAPYIFIAVTEYLMPMLKK
ncbi:MAG: hypothetical protein NE334_19010 [Lentisphaeraceae bacterium]|nr:hypothetical protein [Lentisphaeraceae bacterium]